MSYRQKRGRSKEWREPLMRNLLSELIVHESLTLELARAKELRSRFDKVVTLSKKQTLAARRKAIGLLRPIRDKSGTPVVNKLFDTIATRYSDRSSGYTRVVRTGTRRGDNAEMAVISLV